VRSDLSTVKNQLRQLQALSQKSIWLPTAFIFICRGTPALTPPFSFFTTNELGFQPEFLGRVRLVTSIASLVGVWLFQRFLKTIPFRVIFGWVPSSQRFGHDHAATGDSQQPFGH